MSKLTQWYNNGQQHQRTEALSILINHAETGYYPGLPTIKKLSIMHHLELIGKYLGGDLSDKALALVLEWVKLYRNELLEIWQTQKFKDLPPLK